MPVNSRNKGASFERKIANLLVSDLSLQVPVKRILEQTRTKQLPDLILGNWFIECKFYKSGSEPLTGWWEQLLRSCNNGQISALVYKFNRRPIKVRTKAKYLNPDLSDEGVVVDLGWNDFIYVLKTLYQDDIDKHERNGTIK